MSEEPDFNSIRLALYVWAEMHKCEDPIVLTLTQDPNNLYAVCFTCGDVPPVLREWREQHRG